MRDSRCHRYEPPRSRRDFLFRSGVGLGAIALQSLLPPSARAANSPLSARPPQLQPRAKNVIFLFMEDGPSHLDLFDPKPLPESFGSVITAMGEAKSPLLASQRTWRQHGQSGLWVSDWLPRTRGVRG